MKPVYVAFATKKLENQFESLNNNFENKQLHESIQHAIDEMKRNPLCGLKIQKKLWPKEYIRTYGITNLWKYDLHGGWRLIYTIQADDVKILNVLLEWFDHKAYAKRFQYS